MLAGMPKSMNVPNHPRVQFTTGIVNGKVIEVKSRGGTCSSFTCPEDFPYQTAIVDTVYGFENKDRKPDYYVIVGQDSLGTAVVDCSDRDKWSQTKFYDRYEGKSNMSYTVRREDMKPFEWLVDKLTQCKP